MADEKNVSEEVDITEELDITEEIIDNRKEKKDKKNKKKMNPVLEWVLVIVIAVAAALFINFVIIINSTVPSGSMENTIMTGSRMFGLRLTYLFEEPQRGDIVVFKYPDDESVSYVKRIIGLPGETVEIMQGVTYINGEALDEPYLKETPAKRDYGPYVVPEGCYFMMGDNRNNSKDSRYWENTFVAKEKILGKALFVYWPLDKIGAIK